MHRLKIGEMMKLGWKKDPHNPKDFKFEQLKPRLTVVSTSDEHIINERAPIFDQGRLSSCVANATCGALEILLGLSDSAEPPRLSRLFIYWNARVYTKETNLDEGTYIRDAFDSLRTLGVCLESTWKYNSGILEETKYGIRHQVALAATLWSSLEYV
jgi:C1A family cysteine protease